MLGVFDMLSHVLLGCYKQHVSVNVSFSAGCPSESPGGKGTSYRPSWRSHLLLLTRSANTDLSFISVKAGTLVNVHVLQHQMNCYCSATILRFTLSVSWLINSLTNSFLPSATVILKLCSPFGFPVYLQENKIKCYLQEGLNPYSGLCLFM